VASFQSAINTCLPTLQKAYPEATYGVWFPLENVPDTTMYMKRIPTSPLFEPSLFARPLPVTATPVAPPSHQSEMISLSDEVLKQTRLSASSHKTGRGLLVAIPFLLIGGAEKFALNIMAEFAAMGWHITVVLTNDADYYGGHPWLPLAEAITPDVFVLLKSLNRVQYPMFLCHLIRSRNIEAMISSNSGMAMFSLPLINQKCPVVSIDVSHNWIDGWLGGGYSTFALGLANDINFIAVISDALRSKMIEEGGDAKKLRTVYIGTNTTFYRRVDHPEGRVAQFLSYGSDFIPAHRDALLRYLRNPRAVIVMLTARLSEEKRPILFIEAIAAARSILAASGRADDVVGILVGGGVQREEVSDMITKLGAEEYILAVGAQSADATKQLLNVADIFMMTSRTEGTPLAIFEAMSMRLATIAPRVGGIPEMVTPDIGTLVDNTGAYGEVVQRYAAALVELMSLSDAELRAMQTAAEHRARTLFDTGVMARTLLGLIDEASAAPRLPSTDVSLKSYLTALRAVVGAPVVV